MNLKTRMELLKNDFTRTNVSGKSIRKQKEDAELNSDQLALAALCTQENYSGLKIFAAHTRCFHWRETLTSDSRDVMLFKLHYIDNGMIQELTSSDTVITIQHN